MPPKGKAKAKAKARADADDTSAIFDDEAKLLGIEDWRPYRPSSENLNKTEDAEAKTAKQEAHDKALADGEDATEAAFRAEEAHRRAVFKLKLSKAVKRAKHKAARPPGEEDGPDPAASGAAAPPAQAPAPGGAMVVDAVVGDRCSAYFLRLTEAYNRVVAHKLFKDVASQNPNPVQESEDCGVQDGSAINLHPGFLKAQTCPT